MLLLTTDVLPEDFTVTKLFGLVEVTTPIELTEKNFLRRMTEGEINGHQLAVDNLTKQAKDTGGNLVYGIKTSTAIGTFNNGSFLYLTYIGTVALVEGPGM